MAGVLLRVDKDVCENFADWSDEEFEDE